MKLDASIDDKGQPRLYLGFAAALRDHALQVKNHFPIRRRLGGFFGFLGNLESPKGFSKRLARERVRYEYDELIIPGYKNAINYEKYSLLQTLVARFYFLNRYSCILSYNAFNFGCLMSSVTAIRFGTLLSIP